MAVDGFVSLAPRSYGTHTGVAKKKGGLDTNFLGTGTRKNRADDGWNHPQVL